MHGKQPAPEHADPDRYDRNVNSGRQQRRNAGTETHKPAVAGDSPLRKQAEHLPFAKFAAYPPEKTLHRLRPPDRRHPDHPEIPEDETGRHKLQHLLMDHESDRAARDGLDQQHVDQRNMVRHDQHRARIRDVLQPLHPQPHQRVPKDPGQQLQCEGGTQEQDHRTEQNQRIENDHENHRRGHADLTPDAAAAAGTLRASGSSGTG